MADLPPTTSDPDENQALERSYSRKALLGVAVGLAFQVAGLVLKSELTGWLRWIGWGSFVGGYGFFLWGCYCEAKRNGYHGAFGLLGLASCFGLLVLLALPSQAGQDISESQSDFIRYQRNAVLLIIAGLISPILVVGLLGEEGSALALVVSYSVTVWGSYWLVKRKGYHPAWTIVSLLYLPGLLALFLFPDTHGKAQPKLRTPLRWFEAAVFCVILFTTFIVMIATPMYISYKRVGCDRSASHDLEALRSALGKLAEERAALNCPPASMPPKVLEFMVGPYYGWPGTNRKCEVLVRVEGDEVCACALKGSRPEGTETRYLYRFRLNEGGELPIAFGQCSGKAYGAPGAIRNTRSILKPDCTLDVSGEAP